MKIKIEDLRAELFDTLKKVKEGSLDLDKAKMVCDIGSVIIETARAETEFVKTINAVAGSGFIPIDNGNKEG